MRPDIKRAMSLVGIAKKAGKTVIGTDMAQSAARSKKNGVRLLLCSAEASSATLKRITNTAQYYHIPLITAEIGKSELALCVGKRDGELSVVGITDAGLASAIAETLTQKAE